MTAPTVLLLAGHRYVLAGAVNWSRLTSEVAGLQLTARWKDRSSTWGTLLFLVPTQKTPIAGFDYMIAGHDRATKTPIFVINSTVKGGEGVNTNLLPGGMDDVDRDYQGRGLGKLGYLLVSHYLTTHLHGWLIPDAARGEETSPEAWRVWRTLTTSGELTPHRSVLVPINKGTNPLPRDLIKTAAWSWSGTMDPNRVLKKR